MSTDWTRAKEALEIFLSDLLAMEGELADAKVPADIVDQARLVRVEVEYLATAVDTAADVAEGEGRVFVMTRTHGTEGRARCHVRDQAGQVTPLMHLSHHSPDGFEWGYAGSGPADLARSMVGLVTDSQDPSGWGYQRVKEAFLVAMPPEGGEVRESDIIQVLEAAEAGASDGP